MCLKTDVHGNPLRRVLLLAMALLWITPLAHGDEVAAWLESRGFTRLLAQHYEDQLPSLRGEDLTEGAQRLARLYAQLLLDAKDRTERTWLEARGQQLLKMIPAGEADDLRVELINGRYMVAEDIAERHRLRLDELGEVGGAIESLTGIIEELELIRSRTAAAVKSSFRSVDRGTRFRATSRRQRLSRQSQLLHRTEYLLAWSLAYRAWLADDTADAAAAETLFAKILELESGNVVPENVSVDRRSEDSVAWSVLGMAFCRSMTRSTTTAMQWFNLLEVQQVPESVAQVLPAWRLAVLLEAMDLDRVELLLDELGADGGVVSTSWWRLVAVYALERLSASGARELADRAIAALASRNALDHLYDLVERYGETLAGDEGFALAYARGVLEYKTAQDLAGDTEGQISDEARASYRAAGVLLERAMAEQDRTRWSEALAGCARLLGWCRWHAESFASSRDAFLLSAGEGIDPTQEESFWMAIVCQDRLVREGADGEAGPLLSALMDEYMRRWPNGTRAGTLAVRRVDEIEPSFEAVDTLEQVRTDDPAWHDAQQRASQMLYSLFSNGSRSDRLKAGTRYLVIALPLLSEDSNLAISDAAAAGRCLARSRRVLEVALDEQLLRLVAAEAALASVQRRSQFPMEVPEGFEQELVYRQLQIMLAREDIETAERLALGLFDEDGAGLWSRLAARAIFRQAIDHWNAAEAGEDSRGSIRRVSEWGTRILEEQSTLAEVLDSPGMMAVASNVARAGLVRWEGSGDATLGRATLELYGLLLSLHPRNQQFLRGCALLSAAFDDEMESVRCWRVLLSGTTAGSASWFEARTHQVELLAVLDPERARLVLQQHHVLYPHWGPAPWGQRIRAVQESLLVEVPEP
jgi:hypothetical protein